MELLNSLTITAMAHGGLGVARCGIGVVFVEGAVTGEVVNAQVISRNSRRTLARPVEIIKASPNRIRPPCPLFDDCGGCQLQFIRYETQTAVKEQILKDSLERLGGLDIPLLSPPIMGRPLGYRLRARLKVSRAGTPGFFARRSHRVVTVNKCPVMAEQLNRMLQKLCDQGALCRGMREILLASGRDGTMAAVWGNNSMDALKFMEKTGLKGIIINNRMIHGEPRVRLALPTITCGIWASGFFQANWELNLRMIEAVLELIPPGLDVLDLYAGAGNFALPLAVRGDRVTAVEGNGQAVEDGSLCARRHGIGVRFVRDDVESFLSGGEGRGAAVVLADPPRTGMAQGVTEGLLRLGPSIIVYVSCDPATLARDVRRLGRDYRLVSATMVDLFPQTSQIEAIIKLERRQGGQPGYKRDRRNRAV